jgi:regulator of RNase E activity RraB
MFWNKRPQAKIVSDEWAVYSYGYGHGLRAVISFDVTAAHEEKHVGYDTCVRAVARIPLERVLENGLPDRSALLGLQQLENDFVQALQTTSVACRFVGKMTYGGMRDFVFQVADVPAFKKTIGKTAPRDGLRLELIEKPGWTFFDEKVSPASVYWQQIGDYQVIQRLLEAGSNPQVPHVLEHVFIGDQEQLQTLSADLRNRGFSEISCSDDCLVMGRESLLDLEEVFNVTGELFSFCSEIGVQYDGWGAAVTK